jgi:DNA-binding GntR family transcriptional regulator
MSDLHPGGRPVASSVKTVHDRLRQDILRGHLAPGSVLSQVQLAAEYGVSRTPLREAMRMLQEEGLLHAETNRRARVATFRLDDLEAISAQRILASALATALTVGRMDASALAELQHQHDLMTKAAGAGDAESWRRANVAFHELHTARAPMLLVQDMRRLQERNSLYRAVWLRDEPHLDLQSPSEHHQILAACQARDVVAATRAIARHNARVAITVMANAVPEREPVTIRTALQLALGWDGNGSL